MLPDRSTAIIISLPSVGMSMASPSHCGWLKAKTVNSQHRASTIKGAFLFACGVTDTEVLLINCGMIKAALAWSLFFLGNQ